MKEGKERRKEERIKRKKRKKEKILSQKWVFISVS